MNPLLAKWRNLTPLTKRVIKGIAVAGAGLGAFEAAQYTAQHTPSSTLDKDPLALQGGKGVGPVFAKTDLDSIKTLSNSLRRTQGNIEDGAAILRDSGADLLGRAAGSEAVGRGARAMERGSLRLTGTLRDRLGN